jgi:hypothetical protein
MQQQQQRQQQPPHAAHAAAARARPGSAAARSALFERNALSFQHQQRCPRNGSAYRGDICASGTLRLQGRAAAATGAAWCQRSMRVARAFRRTATSIVKTAPSSASRERVGYVSREHSKRCSEQPAAAPWQRHQAARHFVKCRTHGRVSSVFQPQRMCAADARRARRGDGRSQPVACVLPRWSWRQRVGALLVVLPIYQAFYSLTMTHSMLVGRCPAVCDAWRVPARA